MPYKDPEQRRRKGAEYSRKYYLANKSKVLAANRATRNKAMARWRLFKSTLSCVMCGENHPAALDFHHIEKHESNRKVHALLRNWDIKSAKEEIKKCAVLCANCHRKHHHDERQKQTP